ncbi:hypothetical protein BH160DRAFT_5098 [Burkholderia sp. H160]|nr:hypothetical protein BH160DRAFT_5098 [Burkholderia sp. H160]
MTIHNTLSSTPVSTVANTPATEKSANSGTFSIPGKSPQSTTVAQPTQPAAGAGLVGHLVNTTA